MSTPKKLLYGLLAFITLSSKGILIYNEETIVALTFFVFVRIAFHFVETPLAEALDSRSEFIQKELATLLSSVQKSYKEMISDLNNIATISSVVDYSLSTASTNLAPLKLADKLKAQQEFKVVLTSMLDEFAINRAKMQLSAQKNKAERLRTQVTKGIKLVNNKAPTKKK
uniref:ATP synthase F0 subunit beta n=1 Tax=Oltmannsiellopsis viridis TaxID=51324 RepID=Q0QIR2_OLTVI|nr:ATP synthase F0 subunit beta [Oltmannsiellopsis viridis]ABC96341.1 ATP synthase F0 subunit beta [Oltmannsiellopsis viridis]